MGRLVNCSEPPSIFKFSPHTRYFFVHLYLITPYNHLGRCGLHKNERQHMFILHITASQALTMNFAHFYSSFLQYF